MLTCPANDIVPSMPGNIAFPRPIMTSRMIDCSTTEIDAQADSPGEKPVILIPLSGGGFLSETKDLLTALSPDFAFTYLKGPWANYPGEDGVPIGPYRKVPAFDSFTEPSVLKCGWALTATFFTTS